MKPSVRSDLNGMAMADVKAMSEAPATPQEAVRRNGVLAALICGILCAGYAVLALSAVETKSATWDEPSHAATAWLNTWRQDFRLSPDVPPLWEYWIGLGIGRDSLQIDADAPEYKNLKTKKDLFGWVVETLYRTDGNDGITVVNRGRMMALVLAMALAILIGRFAWKIGGAVAAVAATFLYCLDPNFIGHGPLVKNDVAFALVYFAAAYALWNVGRRITWTSAIALVLLTAAAFAVKLSGVLLGPVLVVTLTARALMPQPWSILGKPMDDRRTKLKAAFLLCLVTVIVTYTGLWATYGFRFNAGPGGLQTDTQYYVKTMRILDVMNKTQNAHPPEAELDAWRAPLSTRIMLYMEKHHLLPQAWTTGFVMTLAGNIDRSAYLMGKSYSGSRWYYFPLAALFKAPLATIAAVVLAIVLFRRRIKAGAITNSSTLWTFIALAVPMLVYGIAILTAPLNIGLRHAFPFYPFVFVCVGLAAKVAWESKPSKPGNASGGQILVLGLGAALAAESLAAFPDYIAFFNIACARHGAWLLSDSNLDWGQDLPLLAAWQREHATDQLYLEYFGLCDPVAYGIHYINVPGGYLFGPHFPDVVTEPGYAAISASSRDVYAPNSSTDFSALFEHQKPIAILGKTIYIYQFDPASSGLPQK